MWTEWVLDGRWIGTEWVLDGDWMGAGRVLVGNWMGTGWVLNGYLLSTGRVLDGNVLERRGHCVQLLGCCVTDSKLAPAGYWMGTVWVLGGYWMGTGGDRLDGGCPPDASVRRADLNVDCRLDGCSSCCVPVCCSSSPDAAGIRRPLRGCRTGHHLVFVKCKLIARQHHDSRSPPF